ncbi:hypothetical protein FVE85_6259 [Porphyridium purpureum]|uniref:Saccharopine dehydrogenase NADP binding domain-containing protein n=1 Tax=Porphyridium purpureum TaxID=35688 RepID=A0A5J4Z6N0_PORPP|nr:hypothetical protein FVE85_6259 [Porphyridium purpureum]|eukprot:POR6273..scf295_1
MRGTLATVHSVYTSGSRPGYGVVDESGEGKETSVRMAVVCWTAPVACDVSRRRRYVRQCREQICTRRRVGSTRSDGRAGNLARTQVVGARHMMTLNEESSRDGMQQEDCNRHEYKVLVLGGTGRVGASTARKLAALVARKNREHPGMGATKVTLLVAGRNQDRGARVVEELCRDSDPLLVEPRFVSIDYTNTSALVELLEQVDLVIHTAGPFQQRLERCEVLRAAVQARTRYYIDVCDDLSHSLLAKQMHDTVAAAGVRAVVSTGIYPGVSNLMAIDAARLLDHGPAEAVQFSYFTSGTGGAGATILASTFLLLSEDALTYKNGKEQYVYPASQVETVDFAGQTGRRSVYVLNLPEVFSIREKLNLKDCRAKFGTEPEIWNWLLRATPRIVPRKYLRNTSFIRALSELSLPAVRFTDAIFGARTSMRVDANGRAGGDGTAQRASIFYEHDNLEECVGTATAAFAWHMLATGDNLRTGVWWPEEAFDEDTSREAMLADAVYDAAMYRSSF